LSVSTCATPPAHRRARRNRAEVLETSASLVAASGLRTSMHDIGKAAGIQTDSLYHLFASKEALLVELLRRYHTDLDGTAEAALDDPGAQPGFARITAFGNAIAAPPSSSRCTKRRAAIPSSSNGRGALRSKSSPIENLDALERFGDEIRIQLAWMRHIPPDAPNPSMEFPTRLKQTKKMLAQEIRSDAITIDDPPTEMLARCVIGLQWVPENILRDIGTRAAQLHLRDTLLRGVAKPTG
jgi:AcrR family transcriptional regulator